MLHFFFCYELMYTYYFFPVCCQKIHHPHLLGGVFRCYIMTDIMLLPCSQDPQSEYLSAQHLPQGSSAFHTA